jgi:hypothetical protein
VDVFPFNQFGEHFRGAFKTKPGIVEAHDGEDLSANFETQIISTLQIFGGIGKVQAVLADFVYFHGIL